MFPRVCIIFVVLISTVASQTDITRKDGAYGSNVVEAVISVLRDACIYPDNQLFLRRLAYVESKDGADPRTFRHGYHGGIWQVDQSLFQTTKTQIPPELTDNIRRKLGIAWSSTTWEDLRKPLFSGLAAAIYLKTKGAPDSIPSSIADQGSSWVRLYRPLEFKEKFINLAQQLNVGCRKDEKMDLLFLFDTSGPVFKDSDIKEFMKNFINSVDIGSQGVQVAVESFGALPQVNIRLTSFTDKPTLLSAISKATLTSGGSDLTNALKIASEDVFETSKGSRNNVAKVIILLSSANMTMSRTGMLEAIKLKNKGVSIYTVGTGLSNPVLQVLASEPSCSHSYTVRDYNSLVNLHPLVAQTSCRVAVGLQVGAYTYPCGSNALVRIQSGSIGSTVKVTVEKGAIEVYGSYVNSQPSESVNNLNQTVSPNHPASFFIKDKRPLTLSVESEHHHLQSCSGNIGISVEPAISKRAECQKKKPDIVLMIDSTNSKSQTEFGYMLEFASRFANNFKIGPNDAQIAMVTYAEDPLNQFWLKTYHRQEDVQNGIRSVQMKGIKPNLASALKFVREQTLTPSYGLRKDSSKIVVVVTGSRPQHSSLVFAEAHLLKVLGVRVIVVAADAAAKDPTIAQLASGPEHIQKLQTYLEMTSAVTKAVVESCGDVQLICMEDGLQRNCRIEDLLASSFGKLIVPDHGTIPFSPCMVKLPMTPMIERFPHPTQKDRFILCDNQGQTYLVLCPLNEIYNGMTSLCEKPGPTTSTLPAQKITTTSTGIFTTRPPPPTTTRTAVTAVPPQSQINPCSGDAMAKGMYYHPYYPDSHKYIHCWQVNASRLEDCDKWKIWRQESLQCEYEFITDQNGQAIPSIHNPCLVNAPAFFPHPTDKKAYIQCDAFGEGFLMHCPGSTQFSPGQDTCV